MGWSMRIVRTAQMGIARMVDRPTAWDRTELARLKNRLVVIGHRDRATVLTQQFLHRSGR